MWDSVSAFREVSAKADQAHATGLSRATLERFVVEGRPLDVAEAKAAGFFDDVVVLRANAAAR